MQYLKKKWDEYKKMSTSDRLLFQIHAGYFIGVFICSAYLPLALAIAISLILGTLGGGVFMLIDLMTDPTILIIKVQVNDAGERTVVDGELKPSTRVH